VSQEQNTIIHNVSSSSSLTSSYLVRLDKQFFGCCQNILPPPEKLASTTMYRSS